MFIGVQAPPLGLRPGEQSRAWTGRPNVQLTIRAGRGLDIPMYSLRSEQGVDWTSQCAAYD